MKTVCTHDLVLLSIRSCVLGLKECRCLSFLGNCQWFSPVLYQFIHIHQLWVGILMTAHHFRLLRVYLMRVR